MVPKEARRHQPVSPIATASVTPAAHGDQYNDEHAGGPAPMSPITSAISDAPLAAPPAGGYDQRGIAPGGIAPTGPTRREENGNAGPLSQSVL